MSDPTTITVRGIEMTRSRTPHRATWSADFLEAPRVRIGIEKSLGCLRAWITCDSGPSWHGVALGTLDDAVADLDRVIGVMLAVAEAMKAKGGGS